MKGGEAGRAQRQLSQLASQHLDGPLRSLGFVRRRNTWLFIEHFAVPILHLRVSPRRDHAIDFTVDWGIFNDEFRREAFPNAGSEPSILRCPFKARLVPAPNFSDQWWEVSGENIWLVNADGSRHISDLSEIDESLQSSFIPTALSVRTLADTAHLMRQLLSQSKARANYVPGGDALVILERLALWSGEDVPQAHRYEDSENQSTALSCFDLPDWVSVERYELDQEARRERDLAGDLIVSYTDVVAVEFQEYVVESASLIRSFPGVVRITHEDDGTFKVWGDVDIPALDDALRRWWFARLGTLLGEG